MLKLNYTVASDRGLVRGNNEDSAYAGPHLLALADGMGGHAAGEVASQIMINHLQALDDDPGDNDILALLGSVADDANKTIAKQIRTRPETAGMGTTCTTLMFDGKQFGMLHVGDSRGYRLRDMKLERITRDDTYVQTLVESGDLDPEDVSTHPQRSLIMKAYTGHPVEPTLKYIDCQPGDRFLLCSDGLSDPVTHSTIETILCQGTPEEAAFRLIELALRSGGPDNVTIVIADVVDTDRYTGDPLPVVPVTGGALNGEDPEEPRPNTSAGRAASMADLAKKQRNPKSVSPSGDVTEQNTDIPDAAVEPKKKGPKASLIALAVLLVLAVAGMLWFNEQKSNNFYVSVADDQIVIEQGLSSTFFSKDLHQVYQVACLDGEGRLKVVDKGTSSCTPFTVNDLKPDTRNALAQLPTSGSYDDAVDMVTRLSESVLPPCVQRGNNPDQVAEGDLNSPGKNCREVTK